MKAVRPAEWKPGQKQSLAPGGFGAPESPQLYSESLACFENRWYTEKMFNLSRSIPRVLSIGAGLNASSITLMKEPLDLLSAEGAVEHRFALSGQARRTDIGWCDLCVFLQTQENIDVRVLNAVQAAGKKAVFLADDDYLNIPPGHMKTPHFEYPHRRRNYLRFLQRCDLVLTTTGRLAGAFGGYAARPVYVFETLPVPDLYYAAPPRWSEDGVFRFLYAASAFNYRHLMDIAAPAIVRVMEEYGPKVHFIFMGGDFPLGPPERRTVLGGRMPYYEFLEKFAAVTADAALAPLDRSEYSLGKSDLKYREYGPRGLAGIYSDTPVYAQSVRHGQTGLLAADGEDDWHAAMARLIDNPAQARAMGLAARRQLEAGCTLRAFADLWRDKIIGPALTGDFAPAPLRPEEKKGGQADLRRPAAFELARRRSQIWRRIRTFWYDAFYLDRNRAVVALKKFLRRLFVV
ncbi:hypothetical protein C4J81_18715 (plasmid) [Deltaproteobacteria bacterium Smac51]|nr:hypothetical protein C4J81_18715 [Deltaproteobacteria bacterium Smac51]